MQKKMKKRTRFLALLVSFFMLFSIAGTQQAMAYVINKDELVTPNENDIVPDNLLNWVLRYYMTRQTKNYKQIKPEDFKGLEEIYYSEGDHYDLYEFNVFVKSMEGLQYATDAYRVLLPYNKISDLSPISKLTKVNKINFKDNLITDLSDLSKLTNIQSLELGLNKIENLEPLKDMTKLEELDLPYNKISNIDVLKKFTNLKKLDLQNNKIKDITALEGLTKLDDRLILGNNQIEDITPLANLTKVKELDLSSNNLSDISVLKNLRDLKILRLSNNPKINDFAALTNLTQLDKSELWLTGTGIGDKKDDLFKVIDVNKIINRFNANNITLEDKDNVEAARNEYNALPQELKAYIPELRITGAENNISNLKKGQPTKYYEELKEFDNIADPIEIKSLKIKVVDEKGQPLKDVKFNLQNTYGDVLKTLVSDDNGIINHKVASYDQYMTEDIVVADSDKYISNVDKIRFKTDGKAKIVEVNGMAPTGKEDLKFILKARNEEIKVDKTNLENSIKEAEGKDKTAYTEESYKAMEDVLAKAKKVFADLKVTQEDVDNITKVLSDAIKALVEKVVVPETPAADTIVITAVDHNGKPLSNVDFNIKNSFNPTVSKVTSDGNGVIKYTTPSYMMYTMFTVTLADEERYSSNPKNITFSIGEDNNIVKVNNEKIGGIEDLKVNMTVLDKVAIEKENQAKIDAIKENVKDTTADNVKKNDEVVINKAVTDLEDLLANIETLTETQKADINTEIARLKEVVNVFETVKGVEEKINNLPEIDDISENDKEAIKAVENEFNAISENAKSLVSAEAKEKLNNTLKELERVINDNNNDDEITTNENNNSNVNKETANDNTVNKENNNATNKNSQNVTTPITGDNMPILALGVLMIISAIAIVSLKRRNQKRA
ncbi:Leucine Rich repeat-containing protein [Clostridium collagenovorans DSM 3089]|uniref:Leucine Rich repeat-containing protein n=1 Tax=Clostridium collagenovorans DSM 3089 TaxID=1121306 RepID=A0A1M5SIF9_9CLOT|nr:leucine-rich repeat domain-containing protein [Clostridium collagenovorans]SHH38279.1 Leucine Rich repeat-containing protein [Clostridium collagenovorans DSM 3089]